MKAQQMWMQQKHGGIITIYSKLWPLKLLKLHWDLCSGVKVVVSSRFKTGFTLCSSFSTIYDSCILHLVSQTIYSVFYKVDFT